MFQNFVLISCFYQIDYNSNVTFFFVVDDAKLQILFLFCKNKHENETDRIKIFSVFVVGLLESTNTDYNLILTMALGAPYLIIIVSCCKWQFIIRFFHLSVLTLLKNRIYKYILNANFCILILEYLNLPGFHHIRMKKRYRKNVFESFVSLESL